MKPEYKYDKRKNVITKDGHTMFLQDVVYDLKCMQNEPESAWILCAKLFDKINILNTLDIEKTNLKREIPTPIDYPDEQEAIKKMKKIDKENIKRIKKN